MSNIVNLTKGETVSLTKAVPTLKKVFVGAGWDPTDSNQTMDADLSAFCLNADGKTNGKQDFIYFGNKGNKGDAIYHEGDNLTGEGEGDDEVIQIDLEALAPEVTEVVLILNIYDAKKKGQDFKQLANAHVRIVNAEDNAEISNFKVTEGLHGELMYFGSLKRDADGWSFTADGKSTDEGLNTLVSKYGLQAAA